MKKKRKAVGRCLQGCNSRNSTANGAWWFHFQLCVLAVVWIAWSVPALLICSLSAAVQQTLTTPSPTGLVGQWKRWGAGSGGRTGRFPRCLAFWRSLLGMEANRDSGASGSFGPRLQLGAPKTLPPSPALISDHRPSTDITIPSRIWILDYSLDSHPPVFQCTVIPNSICFWRHHPRQTQSAALPIHPFVYRPENSRIHSPGRAATAAFSRSHGSRFTLPRPHPIDTPPSHPGPPPTTPHTATAAQSCSHVDGLSLTWGQASFCGPESSLLVSLAHDIQAGLYIPAFPPSIYTRRPQIGTPYPFPSPARANPPSARARASITCNLQLHLHLQAHRRPTSRENSPSPLGSSRTQHPELGPSLASCGLPVPSDLLAISDSTTRNARECPDPPETLASDAVCGQIEGVVPQSAPHRTAPPHRPRASSVASEHVRSLLRLLSPKHRSQRPTLPRPPCCVVV